MIFYVDAAALANALSSIAAASNSKSSLPILSNVAITATGQNLTLRTFDTQTELTATLTLDTPAQRDGATTTSHADLTAIARRLIKRKNPLRLSQCSGDTIDVSCGAYRTTLQALPAEDMPSLERFGDADQITIDSTHLVHDLASVVYAAAVQDVRHYLCGVCLSTGPTGRSIAASDGHRMARVVRPLVEVDHDVSIIIPRHAVLAIISTFANLGDIELYFQRTILTIKAPQITLSTTLIDSTYPDIARIIPRDAANIDISKEPLIDAVETVMTAIGAKQKVSPALIFEMDGDRLKISSGDKTKSSVDFLETNNQWPKIALSPNYVIDVLKNMNGNISAYIPDSYQSARFDASHGGADYAAVIAPMRV